MFCESRSRNIWKKQKYTAGSHPQGDFNIIFISIYLISIYLMALAERWIG